MDEKYNLTWHTYMLHGKEMFRDLMETKRFSDLTLVSDDQYQYKVHRFLLGASSSVFKSILENNPQNTLIFLRGIQHEELELILQFIYLGKATFYQERMKEFLEVADDLNIIGIRDAQLNEESFFINEIKPNAALLGEENIRDEKEINYLEKPLTTEEKEKIDDEKTQNYLDNENEEKLIFDDNKEIDISTSMSIKQVKDFQYPCKDCEKKFVSRQGLYYHFQAIHKKIRYPCKQCNYQSKHKKGLQNHVMIKHEGIKYPCKHCDYITAYQYVLSSHIKKIHFGN